MWSNRWIKGQDYPEWADADVYKKTITGGYLFNGETPRQAYKRVASTVAMRLKKPEMADKFFEYIGADIAPRSNFASVGVACPKFY